MLKKIEEHNYFHVDDKLEISEDKNQDNEVINYLKESYLIASLGEVKYFLCQDINRK